jgi:isoquinoline 1-oxidoreductase
MSSPGFDFSVEPERYELFANPNFLKELTRRDFFRIAGAGLVVALLLHDDVDAQQRPAQRRRRGFGPPLPKEISAWLHIGEDSLVTVFTGKVELGQNIRTSLTQVVAEELQVPPAQVRMVMADTQQTPFDMGTFGSMTTPVMAAHLRLVAATAREVLLDMAAKASSAERGSFRIKKGIVGPDSKPSYRFGEKLVKLVPSYSFGELTHGKKLVKLVDEKVSTTPAEKWTIAGTSLSKVDGRAFVTGEHAYSADVKRPGMLHGKVLRPPTFKATLVSVDTRQAESMPGVTLVHEGDFVAVAAVNEQLADKALDLVKAEWKSQPQPSGAELFKLLKTSPAEAQDFGFRSSDKSGSISDGMAAADLKLDATYTIAYIAHAPLEPRAAVADWSDGKLTVWTGTQRPFGVRGDLASALKLQPDRVHVIVPDTGSGYGGKHTGEAALEAARLAKAAGKPV